MVESRRATGAPAGAERAQGPASDGVGGGAGAKPPDLMDVVPHDPPSLHHELHALKFRDVGERIA